MMVSSFKKFFTKLFVFNDVANRSEFWWPTILSGLILSLYAMISGAHNYFKVENGVTTITQFNAATIGFILLGIIFWIGLFTVRARRLHDVNRSNWWILLSLTGIGEIVLFIFYILPSNPNSRWRKNNR